MAATKSLLSRKLTVDVAERAHNCQHAASHRIERGHRRLKVPTGRSFEHFCVACAVATLTADIAKLERLREALTSPAPVTT